LSIQFSDTKSIRLTGAHSAVSTILSASHFDTSTRIIKMPFGWGESEESYDRVYNNDNFEENKSSFGHEVIAGGAAFAGFKAFEDHQRNEGLFVHDYTPL
jgi:hypothetical protein